MLAVRVLAAVSVLLEKQRNDIRIPEKTAADEGAPPAPWTPPGQLSPYWAARNKIGRCTALQNTVAEFSQAIAESGTEPHHELLIIGLRNAAAAETAIAEHGATPQPEYGPRMSRAATLREIADLCETAVSQHTYGDGHRPRTFKMQGKIDLAAYGSCALWGQIALYFREQALTATDPQVQGSRRTLYYRCRDEYNRMRGQIPMMGDLADLPVPQVQPQAAGAALQPLPPQPAQSAAARRVDIR